jgi:hypothetical protein
LFIGGRAGAGKSSVGSEVHAQLSAARVRHALIEGDNLDHAYPPPREHRLAERNLAAVWSNYRARQQLAQREIGGALQAHIARGKVAARELEKLGCIVWLPMTAPSRI